MTLPDPAKNTTRCTKCGTVLYDIDLPFEKVCKCGAIRAYNGKVTQQKHSRPVQDTMFPVPSDYAD